MTTLGLAVFLPSVDSGVGRSYLERIYRIQPDQGRSSRTSALFVRYFPQQIPSSYESLSQKFPGCCFLSPQTPLGARAVIFCDTCCFEEVLKYSSSLACKRLSEDLACKSKPNDSQKLVLGDKIFDSGESLVMGILNVTPDSFFDGGKFDASTDFAKVAEAMIDAGADIIDVGGESTRPGSMPVDEATEIQRVLPVIKSIQKRFNIPLSIDTTKPEVAKAALQSGAVMVNDVSGLQNEAMAECIQKHKAGYCLMHSRGLPKTMQDEPFYHDVLAEVYGFLSHKTHLLVQAGVSHDKILIDPGIGFGKTLEHNLDLLRMLSGFLDIGPMLMVGTSNKSWIGKALGKKTGQRMPASLASYVLAKKEGAHCFRVHHVAEARDALDLYKIWFG